MPEVRAARRQGRQALGVGESKFKLTTTARGLRFEGAVRCMSLIPAGGRPTLCMSLIRPLCIDLIFGMSRKLILGSYMSLIPIVCRARLVEYFLAPASEAHCER